MKIVYFSYLYDLFGISIGSTIKAIELLRGLESLGHEVKIHWRKSQPRNTGTNGSVVQQSFIKKQLARFLHDPKQLLSNLKYLPEEMRILSQEKPDVLITRLDLYLFSSLLAARMTKLPVILEADAPCVYESRTFHGEFKGIPGLAEAIESWNLRSADASFCVSNAARDHFLEKRKAPDSLKVISNGVDLDRFSPGRGEEIRSSLGIADKIVVGFVGSFHYWHGVDNLAEVVKRSIAENPDIHFLLIGQGGPMQDMLRKALSENDVHNKVTFTGYIEHDRIPDHVAAMDIVLAPYPQLDFFYYSPVKVYEYMACGKPVITTRTGQLAELIADGQNGFLTEPGALSDILDHISKLSRDKEARERIGKEARKLIEASHSWNHKARELEKICQQVIFKYEELRAK